MEVIKLENLTVGSKVIINNTGKWSVETVSKVNPATFVVNGKTYRAKKDYFDKNKVDSWYSPTDSWSRYSYSAYPATDKEALRLVRETEERNNSERIKAENKKAEELSNAAEMEAFYATEEGKVFRALHEDWVGIDTRVDTVIGDGSYAARRAILSFHFGANNNKEATVEVVQKTDDNWEDKTYTLKKCQVELRSGDISALQAEAFAGLIVRAVNIAKIWDRDAGKLWDRDAKVAIEGEN